jgi:hypothetical protein
MEPTAPLAVMPETAATAVLVVKPALVPAAARVVTATAETLAPLEPVASAASASWELMALRPVATAALAVTVATAALAVTVAWVVPVSSRALTPLAATAVTPVSAVTVVTASMAMPPLSMAARAVRVATPESPVRVAPVAGTLEREATVSRSPQAATVVTAVTASPR